MSEALVVRSKVIDSREDEITALESEVKRLRRELVIADTEIAKAKAESTRALNALRKQLSPLYRALQAVFGELDEAGIGDAPISSDENPRTRAVWNNWKSRMGSAAKIIDALLLHGEMNTQQLAIATGYHRTTIPAMIFKLNKAGLLNKNGGRFSLKQL